MSEGNNEWSELVEQLRDKQHLTRQRALRQIAAELKKSPSAESVSDLCAANKVLWSETSEWESLQSAFLLAAAILPYQPPSEWVDLLIPQCHEHLQNSEVRVRLAVADLLKALAAARGIAIYEEFREQLLSMIVDNFERTNEEQEEDEEEETDPDQPKKHGTELMHDTEGWKSLETSLIALRLIIEGVGNEAFVPHLNHHLLEITFRALKHTNRFVREGGFFTVKAFCTLCNSSEVFQDIAMEIAKAIALGLGDNWSQVRFAASVACREFMQQVREKERYYPLLLPRMCLNRYYVAEGVRLYSLTTWKEVVGAKGRESVASCMKEVVEYYVEQARANNHAVREAACHCTAELGLRMEPDDVRPFVDDLLRALMLCFKDASWPVRDAACTACGNFILAFPEESKPAIEELYTLWCNHLVDNIASVRDNSAIALGNYLRAYKDDVIPRIKELLSKNMPKALEQPISSHLNQNMENTTIFGVAAKKLRDNDYDIHSQKQLYSCGSLGPKLKRGTGDKDHGFENGVEPWEATDGALYLLREYSSLYPEDPFITSFFPLLIEISALRSFAHFHFLLECLWNQVVAIARNIGSRFDLEITKQFVPALVDCVQCDNRTAANAAGYAAQEIRKLVGESAFDALLSTEQREVFEKSPFVTF